MKSLSDIIWNPGNSEENGDGDNGIIDAGANGTIIKINCSTTMGFCCGGGGAGGSGSNLPCATGSSSTACK